MMSEEQSEQCIGCDTNPGPKGGNDGGHHEILSNIQKKRLAELKRVRRPHKHPSDEEHHVPRTFVNQNVFKHLREDGCV